MGRARYWRNRSEDIASAHRRLNRSASFLAMHVGWGLGVWSRALELARRKVAQ